MSGLVIVCSSDYRSTEVRVFMHASRLAKPYTPLERGREKGKKKKFGIRNVWNADFKKWMVGDRRKKKKSTDGPRVVHVIA